MNLCQPVKGENVTQPFIPLSSRILADSLLMFLLTKCFVLIFLLEFEFSHKGWWTATCQRLANTNLTVKQQPSVPECFDFTGQHTKLIVTTCNVYKAGFVGGYQSKAVSTLVTLHNSCLTLSSMSLIKILSFKHFFFYLNLSPLYFHFKITFRVMCFLSVCFVLFHVIYFEKVIQVHLFMLST